MRPDEQRALVELLHGPPDSASESRVSTIVDFDGGVRQPALGGGGDPHREHGQLVAGLLRGDLATYEWEMRQRNPRGRW